jgi:hypothetical protein
VQIEGSTVPSTSDFKGLQFEQNVTSVEEEVYKCVKNLVLASRPYGLEKFARFEE